VVYVALILVVLLAFVGLAVDIGYMYVVETQLQNAADSAALAGASLLDGSKSILQNAAREGAKEYAAHNKAAGQKIDINLNTGNDSSGDIVVGYWNGTDVVTPGTYQPINAVKVTTRRTAETGTGIAPSSKVSIFFGKVIKWNQMPAKATAVAYLPPISTAPMPFCVEALNICNGNCDQKHTFYFKKQDTKSDLKYLVGLTEFQPFTTGEPPQNTNYGPDSLVAQMIRGEVKPPNVCGLGIYTNTAGAQQIVGVMIDSAAYAMGLTLGKNDKTVESPDPSNKYWDVVVPVGCILDSTGTCGTNKCDPPVDSQGKQNKITISTYARVHITDVYSNPTPSFKINYIKDIGCNPNPKGLGISAVLIK
jgi:hypothetical protein